MRQTFASVKSQLTTFRRYYWSHISSLRVNINEKLTCPPATLNVIQFDVLQKQLQHDLSFCMDGIWRMNSTCSFLVASAHIPWFRITLLQQSNITLYEINTLQHLLLVMFAVNVRTVRSVASNIRTAMCLAETLLEVAPLSLATPSQNSRSSRSLLLARAIGHTYSVGTPERV